MSPPVLIGYNGSPDTRFFRETTRLMSWPDGELYLRTLQSLVVSLLSLVSTLVFSLTGGVLSYVNFSTHRFLRFSPRNLCSLVMLAVFSFHLRCIEHSLLLSYLFRIGRIENPSCSACGHSSHDTFHLILHCPATHSLGRLLFGDSLSLYDSGQALGSCPASEASWSSAISPSLERGQVTTTTTIYCYSGYQVFLINSFYLALLVM